jgi:hypothetical protein
MTEGPELLPVTCWGLVIRVRALVCMSREEFERGDPFCLAARMDTFPPPDVGTGERARARERERKRGKESAGAGASERASERERERERETPGPSTSREMRGLQGQPGSLALVSWPPKKTFDRTVKIRPLHGRFERELFISDLYP